MLTGLGWDAGITIVVVIIMLFALIRDFASPDMVLVGSLGLLILFGVLSPEDAFAGLDNKAVLTIAALFVIAAGVQNTGAFEFADRLIFPRGKNLPIAIARLMLTTASMSAFLNNTPIVAMLIPRVRAWCEKTGVPASKMMIPLSYAAIVGGMTTLIGTSTNLLVAGYMEASGYTGLRLFELAWVGVPVALATIVYFFLVGHRLLPDRSKARMRYEDGLRDCMFELRIAAGSPLAGQSVEEAGLRALADAYLVHMRRGELIIPSSPDATLRENDVLAFVGSATVLVRLLEKPGLERLLSNGESSGDRFTLPLYEAVVSPSSDLVGKNLREIHFRENYHGVVVGIHRREANIEGPLSSVPIQAGDLLLIEAPSGFDQRWNQKRDEFYLVAPRRLEKAVLQIGKAPIALAILAGVVLLAAFDVADILTTSIVGALAMIATRCLNGREARRAIDFQVLIVIAAALGIGRAIESSGLAASIANVLTSQTELFGAVGVVAAIFIATSLLTEIITNNAAAALMMGVALAASEQLGVPPSALAVAVAVAASCSFLTPIGYQTNLMVMAAGDYRFSDFIKTGLFVNVITTIISITMISLVWL